MVEIYNESCQKTLARLPSKGVDVILTSPFYNTNTRNSRGLTTQTAHLQHGKYSHVRYDTPVDNMTNDEYDDFTENLFVSFDKVLSENGVILYNISYGNENTSGMFTAVSRILAKTNFTIADVIVWKKKSAMPNNCSPNRLTRIWEFVFVFCRKSELKTFYCNKSVTSHRKTGQAMYEVVYNFIEAKNNDGSNPWNKATYSTELCEKLLRIYAPKGGTVYDPFMGTGTTAVACVNLGLDCYGSEISENQCKYASDRISKTQIFYNKEEHNARPL